MYKAVFLPIAYEDINSIFIYIAEKLRNHSAAENLLTDFERGIKQIQSFPYSCKVYQPLGKLEEEIRMLVVKNYIVFYRVLEDEKTIEIQRVQYAKRNFIELL